MTPELKSQIEAAFDYRGHVTIALKDGTKAEGYLFNRQFSDLTVPQEGFVEIFLKGNGEKRRFAVDSIASLALTGEDCAAGNSYEDYLKKKAAAKPAA